MPLHGDDAAHDPQPEYRRPVGDQLGGAAAQRHDAANDTAQEPRAEYARRIAIWDQAIARGERTHLRISNVRLGTALVAALAAWLVFFRAAAPIAAFLAPAAGFLALLAVHALVLQKNERAARARRLYVRGLDRIDGRWPGTGPDGARFAANHPYAGDLDLFGPASLFELLNTTRTEIGELTLADWLGAPAPLPTPALTPAPPPPLAG